MKHLNPIRALLAALALAMFLPGPAPLAADPPKEPAHLAISVSPEKVAPGGAARITVRIQPKDGVKINRYPKMKFQVPAQDGVAEDARVEVGNDRPPAPDNMDANYYETVDPLELDVRLMEGVASGKHELEAKITYFYCVTASGFCAPKRAAVTIPIEVR